MLILKRITTLFKNAVEFSFSQGHNFFERLWLRTFNA